ncbi:MAG: hypothetical protein B6I36_09885 [Desulfobacteraceae bacterium 4572_35.1]|nr:MAG: hypothetical protein B6I36_09885 [Desulfobacteraceae bacterium 4572_35.1]
MKKILLVIMTVLIGVPMLANAAMMNLPCSESVSPSNTFLLHSSCTSFGNSTCCLRILDNDPAWLLANYKKCKGLTEKQCFQVVAVDAQRWVMNEGDSESMGDYMDYLRDWITRIGERYEVQDIPNPTPPPPPIPGPGPAPEPDGQCGVYKQAIKTAIETLQQTQ